MAQQDDFLSRTVESVKSIGKLLLQSRGCPSMPQAPAGSQLVVLGNGPSLRALIDSGKLNGCKAQLLAVNFAANTPEFLTLRPRYYVIADPHFFQSLNDANVAKLLDNLRSVSWPMTLFVPLKAARALHFDNPNITIVPFNCLGVEGYGWLRRLAFGSRRGMPRPRNVLIPSLMIGLWMGYKTILVAGADHSWTRTLEVNSNNEVVSVQPHFYTDNEHEQSRITSVYKGVRLHEIIHSFYVAFKAYFEIEAYARSTGAKIINITPGSFIDAFARGDDSLID